MYLTYWKQPAAAVLLLIGFFSWILPLGAFIDAHQEGLICNGRRLVCLCTHRQHRHEAEPAPLTFRRPGGHGEPSLSSPSFGGAMDTVLPYRMAVAVTETSVTPEADPVHSFPALLPPEPVPKSA